MCPETTTQHGRRTEELALKHLEAHGLELLERNFRCRGGELDLVMRDGDVLVLVEVRSRRSNRFGGAAASIDSRKQRRLALAARALLAARPQYRRHAARFDVVAFGPGDSHPAGTSLEWIRDAFRLG
jgi:putative endonuclease